VCADLTVEQIQLAEDNSDNTFFLVKANDFLETFDIETLEQKKEIILESQNQLESIANEIEKNELKAKGQEKKSQLLKEVPCGSEYSHCKFIKDAYAAIDNLSITKKHYATLQDEKKNIKNKIVELDTEKVNEHLEKYQKVLSKRNEIENKITNNDLMLDKSEIQLHTIEKEIEELNKKRTEYYTNQQLIESKGNLIRDSKEIKKDIESKEENLSSCQDELNSCYKEHGSLDQKLISLKEQKKELEDLREEYSAYDLFMHCMHSSGISYDIIKKKLPVINNEIAKVLANVVNFEIFFEDDGKRLKIFIKHSKHEPRPIEMGSGAEKTIAAMAIRLALLSVSNLPKSNIFILDEPGAALDAENMDGFVSILEIIKSYFKVVLLVSHLDSLKDCVDMQITIDKSGDYAHVFEK